MPEASLKNALRRLASIGPMSNYLLVACERTINIEQKTGAKGTLCEIPIRHNIVHPLHT